MKQLYYLIVLLVIASLILAKLNNKQKKASEISQYSKKKNFLSPAERSFWGVLRQAVGDEFEILTKVRLADIVSPVSGLSKRDWQKAFNSIASKHLDFLLFNKNNLEVVCAIELNDKSHKLKQREIRDELVDSICKSANIPLFKVQAKNSYKIDDIRNLILTRENDDKTDG